ncbi:MAG TPA: hypothetical protein VL123_02950 [Candidatus Udaeobacter sp.]|nr:hypothetical protein [Candidatus Udaeobacter sp.]
MRPGTVVIIASIVMGTMTATISAGAQAPRDSTAGAGADSAGVDLAAPADSDSTLEGEEPPDDADPERDYEIERDDLLAKGSFEMGYAFSQRAGSSLRRRRLLRVREPTLEAHVRDGQGDPLAGAELGTRVRGGWLATGRLAPRWGRGLVLGTPGDPWRSGFMGAAAARSRAGAGDGVEYRARDLPVDLLVQRVRRVALGGFAVDGAHEGAGMVVRRDESRARSALFSLWSLRPNTSGELGADSRGRWRGEGVFETASPPFVTLAGRLGHTAFDGAVPPRTLAPRSIVATAWHSPPAPISLALAASWWRFRTAATGARAALEVRADLPQHDRIAAGWEERHGRRRVARTPGSACDCGSGADGFRQGLWLEWRGGPPGFTTTARQEISGARSGLRSVTRRAASAGVTATPVRGIELGIASTVYRSRSGEPQYLSEDENDRRVLHALAGAGRRSRMVLMFPAAGGRVRATLVLTQAADRVTMPQWTLDWTARTRTR